MTSPDDDLRALLDDEHRRSAGDRRRRRHWVDQRDRAEATLAGVLVDLAEAARPVAVSTAATTCTGRVEAVGADVVVLRPRSGGGRHLVPLQRIVQVRPSVEGDARREDEVTTGRPTGSPRRSRGWTCCAR